MTKALREFEPLLRNNGYKLKRIKGSHYIYSNGKHTVAVNKDLNRMVKRRLVKEMEMV